MTKIRLLPATQFLLAFPKVKIHAVFVFVQLFRFDFQICEYRRLLSRDGCPLILKPVQYQRLYTVNRTNQTKIESL